ncbi:MAG: NAD(P)-binding protein, partial [Blastochloris sp.]|nr:NAD(P)-binding protein [Blastochloris sp.]
MKTPLHIAIVGAGTAGPAAALFLARNGHVIDLFDRAPQNLPVGAGFLLQPTGLEVLRELGLVDSLLPHTAQIRRLHCLNLKHPNLVHVYDLKTDDHGDTWLVMGIRPSAKSMSAG